MSFQWRYLLHFQWPVGSEGVAVSQVPDPAHASWVLIGGVFLGIAALAVQGDPGEALAQLTTKVRRVEAGEEDIDFAVERDDIVGELYDAVGDLVASHRDRERELEESERYRQRLYEISSNPNLTDDEKIERLLELGCERLDVESGVITSIDESSRRYEIRTAVGRDFVTEGTVTDLFETFCRKTVVSDDILGIYNASEEGYENDPGYRRWNIGCYVGAKILVEDDLYGTLCFVNEEPHDEPFTHTEKAFVDLMSRWVSHIFQRQVHRERLQLANRAIAAAPVGVTITDPTREDNPLVKVNEAFEELTDYDASESIGRNCRFLQGPNTEAEPVDTMRQAVADREPVTVELRNYWSDGTQFWNRVSIAPVRDDEGNVTNFVGFQEDVTEHKERECELEQSERLFQAVFDDPMMLVGLLDPDGTLRQVNQTAFQYVDVGRDSVIGEPFPDTPWWKDTPSDDVQQWIDRAAAGEYVAYEAYLDDPNDSRYWVNGTYRPVTDEAGNVMSIVVSARDVTDRKERERELLDLTGRYDTVVSNAPVILYALDANGVFTLSEGKGLDELGLEPGGVVGESVFDVYGWHGGIVDDVERALGGEQVQEMREVEGRTFESIYQPVFDESGTVTQIIGVSVDITKRKERERELRETNEHLSAVFEASPDALVALDLDGNVELWNPAAEHIFGWSEDEVLGEPLPVVQEDLAGEFERYRNRIAAGESLTGVEIERRTKDGAVIDVSLAAAPLRDEDGDVVGIMGVLEDITEYKEKERQVRERERELERYREYTEGVLNAIDDVFYIVDEDWNIRRWNESLREVSGYDEGEMAGMNVRRFFDEDDADRIVAALDDIDNRVGDPLKASIRTADGESIPYEFVAAPLQHPEGGRVVAGIGRDVTKRKQYERELERTKDLLQQAGRVANVGGWEIDVHAEGSHELTVSDEVYRIYDLPLDADVNLPEAIEYFHPEDRDRIREEVEKAIERGEAYDVEVRLVTAKETTKWVRAIGEPVVEDDSVVAVRGSIQDITEQKEREFALASLHESTRGLLKTERPEEAAELVVDAAESVLDVSAVGIYLYDEETNCLQPTAVSSGFAEYSRGEATPVRPDEESFLWHSFVTDTFTVIEDADAVTAVSPFLGSIDHGLVMPIGSQGVLVVGDDRTSVDAGTRQLLETLVATTEAAIDRLQSEAQLRERDAELEAQNERLRRQIRINETIRSVDRSLIGATSQAELEADVCERLTDGDDITFAWIGGFNSGGESLVPRARAGEERGYLDSVELDEGVAIPEPSVETAASGSPSVVPNVAQNVQREAWRRDALAANFQSVLAVPLAFDEYSYGVLAVYAAEPRAFDDLERRVFAELGESIANAISSVSTKQALHADTQVSLTLRIEDATNLFTSVARAANCMVSYEGLATHAADETRLFIRTTGADSAVVVDALANRHAVRSHRLISESDDGNVFEVTIRGTSLVSKLVRHGGHPRSITADSEGLDIVVDVGMSTDVRAFVEMLEKEYDVELVGRREVTRPLQTNYGLVETILDDLTERQREVLRTAYFAGFFNRPRDTTGEELASMLGISQPTVNRHLRLAEQRIMDQLFDDETVQAG